QIVDLVGMNVQTVDKCMKELCAFGLVIKVDGNNAKNQGNEYALQMDDRQIDLSGLMAWAGKRKDVNKRRGGISSYKSGVARSHTGTPVPPYRGSTVAPETQKPLSKANRSSHTTAQIDFSALTVEQAYKVPTLAMYRRAAGFFPGKMTWEFVDKFIRENSITEEQIKTAATAWALRGHKQSNVEGILEWARDGVPAQRKPTQPKGKKRADGEDPIEKALRG
ncbi:MAG: hypothetical protein J0M11_03635, partial [Anaerolineae bacterium]|nr:hypothetical protein [Anaerolineae bacterium]